MWSEATDNIDIAGEQVEDNSDNVDITHNCDNTTDNILLHSAKPCLTNSVTTTVIQ